MQSFDYRYASLWSEPTTEAPAQYSSSAFRILQLLPDDQDQPITCKLLVRRLRHSQNKQFPEPEPYDALSYHWGDPSSPRKITILANNNRYCKDIGRELYDALSQFRGRERPINLWVDALCINQDDKDEKSVQIPLMRRIYGNAEQVRVWLGKAAHESDLAMEFVDKCLDDFDRFDELAEASGYSRSWAALSHLIRRRWFSRRWIIQEIALPKNATVHCGNSTVEWQRFASVIKMASKKQAELRKLFRQSREHKNHPDLLGDLTELGAIRLADIASHLFRKTADGNITERKFSLEALMSSLTAFEASDPHDVLYAILWLAKDAHAGTKQASKLGRARASSRGGGDYESMVSPTVTTFGSSAPPSPQEDGSNPGTFDRYLEPDTQEGAGPTTHLLPPLHRGRKRTNSGLIKTPDGSRPQSAQSHQAEHLVPSGISTGQNALAVDETAAPCAPNPQVAIYPIFPLNVPDRNQQELEAQVKAVDLLVTRMSRSRIVIDYEKTVLEVCKDFLSSAIGQSNSLDMICMPWAPIPNGDETLPSWIPQLTGASFQPTDAGILRRVNADSLVKRFGHQGTGQKPYNAAKGLPAKWHFGGKDDKSLFADGFIFDTVKEKEAPADNGAIPAEWMRAGGWIHEAQPPPEIFWRTLVGNLDSEGKFAPMYWSYSCHDAIKRRARRGPVNTTEILHDCPSMVQEFLERVQRVTWSRRLVLLERLSNQSLALTPKAAKKGDLICILSGCSVPVVLRRLPTPPASHEASKHVYQFIGECYVHDMMDGEAIDFKRKLMRKAGETEMFETFQLR